MGKYDVNKERGRQDPMSFVIKQLKIDDAQLEKMELINIKHHHKMMSLNNGETTGGNVFFDNVSIVPSGGGQDIQSHLPQPS